MKEKEFLLTGNRELALQFLRNTLYRLAKNLFTSLRIPFLCQITQVGHD